MPEYNMILAGQYGVGKSSLFYRLRSGEPPEGVTEGITSRNTTRTWGDDDGGVDNFIYKKQIDGRQVNVTLWDTGGQERHDSMTANYYRHAHAVIFVYSVDDEGSLYALNDWVREAKSMNRQPENLVLAVWGSKSDLDSSSSSAVKQEAVDAFTSAYHIPPHLNCKVSIFGSSAELAMNELVEHVDRLFNGSAAADMQPLHRDFDTLTPQQLVPPTDAQRKTWNCCSGIRS